MRVRLNCEFYLPCHATTQTTQSTSLRCLNVANHDRKCIHLQDCFDFRNHICIVTELLGMSVFDFLKGNNFVPFPPQHVQHFAKQLLESVACNSPPPEFIILMIVLHSLNLVHTDLKPENILLVSNESYDVRCTAVSFLSEHELMLAWPKDKENARQHRSPLDRLWKRNVQ